MMSLPQLTKPTLFTITLPGCPVTVVAAHIPAAREDDTTKRLASGWGATPQEAFLRCAREVAERLSGQYFGTESVRYTSQAMLGDTAMSPHEIALFDDQQFVTRTTWNLSHAGFNEVPTRWTSTEELEWIATTRRLSSVEQWLPAALCFLGFPAKPCNLPLADSNGLAAGEDIEDAAIRAFFELVERDAVAIWWYNRIARPRIGPSDVEQPLASAYASWCRGRQRDFLLQDLTHDLEIPVASAISCDEKGGRIAIGFGAGPTFAEAVRHAVGELAQCEANVALITARYDHCGDAGMSADAKALFQWTKSANLDAHPYLVGKNPQELPQFPARWNLTRCHELCRRQGLEFLALDLSRVTIGIPVARVVVPGLRPPWSRFAPGRLFDVPVRMGWRTTPLPLDALNPVPIMF
jgi:thiazole/oxazole-forming peptide maturase SagD family component